VRDAYVVTQERPWPHVCFKNVHLRQDPTRQLFIKARALLVLSGSSCESEQMNVASQCNVVMYAPGSALPIAGGGLAAALQRMVLDSGCARAARVTAPPVQRGCIDRRAQSEASIGTPLARIGPCV
jgi:hypothetical protein